MNANERRHGKCEAFASEVIEGISEVHAKKYSITPIIILLLNHVLVLNFISIRSGA